MVKRRAKIAISYFLVAFLISSMTAFQFKAGQCPEVEAMKDFEMNRVRIWSIFRQFPFTTWLILSQFLGVWHVIQGTLTGSPVECITFNVTKRDSNQFSLTQLPQNWPSQLIAQNKMFPSRMNINMNSSSDANFDVLVTDYGEKSHMFSESRVDIFIAFLENFAGFFICKNSFGEHFERAAAILSRTKTISKLHYSLVKQSLRDNEILDEDLTIVVSCDWNHIYDAIIFNNK